jgi:hypothetical protein
LRRAIILARAGGKTDCRPELHVEKYEDRMISEARGVLERCQNVFAFEVRIVVENLFETCAGTEEFENVSYSDPHAANARAAAALGAVDGDAAGSRSAAIEGTPVSSLG